MNSPPAADSPQQAAPGGAGAAPGGQARACHAALCGDPAAEPRQRRRALLRRDARDPAGAVRRRPQGDRARARHRPAAGAAAQPQGPGASAAATRTTRRCKASAAPSRPTRRSPTPTATAARCSSEMGRAAEALADFDRALALRPNNAEDHLQPGERAGRSRPARRGAGGLHARHRADAGDGAGLFQPRRCAARGSAGRPRRCATTTR